MPRPTLPPTPASSTEIKGQDGSAANFSQMSFELPPPAFTDSRPSSAETKESSTSEYHPVSPKAKRRLSVAAMSTSGKDAFALPPPPSRSRKIIQMRPKGRDDDAGAEEKAGGKSAGQTKKKQPSATSAAGRKIARKTAHSLIERRRRSKMNEEFGVLKNMIPACTGEMHKLAILQASIDYVRYLEDCVAKLKAANSRSTPMPDDQQFVPPTARTNNYANSDEASEGSDGDVEMANSQHASPVYAQPHAQSTPYTQSHQQSISPVILPQDSNSSYARRESYATSVASSYRDSRHYSYSSATSPSFGPQRYEYAGSVGSAFSSALTSPALMPLNSGSSVSGALGERMDQEATAALLMLNSDRRGTHASLGISEAGKGRGMSVKDLLSS